MSRTPIRNGNGAARNGASKYDAHHKVLSQTYGAFADLRRELSDSKTTVNEREDILKSFAICPDSQRAWLLLEDYFEKLSLSRRDFPATDWWPKIGIRVQGKTRLEELAFLFLRAKRSVPPELQPHASLERFARAEEAEQEVRLVRELENWLAPAAPLHLDTPRATLRVVCQPQPDEQEPARYRLAVQFLLLRPRTGEKARSLHDLVDLVVRAAHEQELFTPWDWEFIQWIYDTHRERASSETTQVLADAELLQWLARWGHTNRLESAANGQPLHFYGHVVALAPHLENGDKELSFTHRIALPDGEYHSVGVARFFNRQSPVALLGNEFFLLRNAPPNGVLKFLAQRPSVPVRRLSHRLLLHLRKTQSNHGVDWEQLCVAHPAAPQFVFELLDDTVQLRLLAHSSRDKGTWVWNGTEWTPHNRVIKAEGEKPENPRRPAFGTRRAMAPQASIGSMQEPGLWLGDANENFLPARWLEAWASKPKDAEFLGNGSVSPSGFLTPRALEAAPGRQRQRHRLAGGVRRMGSRRHEAVQSGDPRPAGRRDEPVRMKAAEQQAGGGTGYARRAGRARGHGRHGRGWSHRRAAKSGHGTRGPFGRGRIHPLCRHAGSPGLRTRVPRFQGRAQGAEPAQNR